jgi:hypothetical protein
MDFLKTFSLFATVATVISLTGCQQAKTVKTQESVSAGETATQAQDTLAAWLAEAKEPTVVACSVSRDIAPTAVDGFNAIAEKVAAIYQAVYAEAQETATARDSGDVMADAVLAKVAEGVANGETSVDWKSAAQDAVISNYQETVKAIEEQRKTLADYSVSLKSDPSVAAITNGVEKTSVLIKMGKDTAELGRQLKAAGEGASAIRMRRISTALGK